MPEVGKNPEARRNGIRVAIDPCYVPFIDNALAWFPGTYKSRPDFVNAAVDFYLENVILPTRVKKSEKQSSPREGK